MYQVRLRIHSRRNPIPFRHRAVSQALQLRKDEPHPMTPFAAIFQLPAYLLIHAGLRLHKPLQIVRIIPIHSCWLSLSDPLVSSLFVRNARTQSPRPSPPTVNCGRITDNHTRLMTTNKKRLRVGVLFGGRSGEHEVSLASAASVIRGLDPDKYEAVPIGISKEGHWLVGNAAHKMLPEVLKAGQRVVMAADPTDAALIPLDRSGSGEGGGQRLDVVFPVMHGTYGEDGTIQGLLDLAGLPFVGAGVLGSAVGMDKDVAKKLLQAAKIPVVPWVTVHRYEWEKNPKQVQKTIESKFKYPVFVKPAALGSSVGMTKVHSRAELAPALNLASEFAMKILVEKSVSAREIEVSVLGNNDPKASIPGEIVPHREFYDYTAKYLEDGTQRSEE